MVRFRSCIPTPMPTKSSSSDLIAIEEKMHEIIKSNYKLIHEDAINFFQSQGENYKVQIISSIQENEKLTLYAR